MKGGLDDDEDVRLKIIVRVLYTFRCRYDDVTINC